jgi:hypothetical protein
MSRAVNAEKADERIQEFGRKKNAATQTTGLVPKDDSLRAKRMFAARQGQWTFYVEGDRGYALKVDQIQKTQQVSLEKVKHRVIEDYYQKEAHRLLANDLKAAKNMARTASLEEVKKKFGGSLSTTGMIAPNDQAKLATLNNLPIRAMLAVNRLGAVGLTSDDEGGFVFKLIEIEPFDETQFAAHKDEITSELYSNRKAVALRSFIASLYRNATINLMNATLDT